MIPDSFPGGCFFKNNFDVIEALQVLFKVFFNSLYIYDFEQAKRVRVRSR